MPIWVTPPPDFDHEKYRQDRRERLAAKQSTHPVGYASRTDYLLNASAHEYEDFEGGADTPLMDKIEMIHWVGWEGSVETEWHRAAMARAFAQAQEDKRRYAARKSAEIIDFAEARAALVEDKIGLVA